METQISRPWLDATGTLLPDSELPAVFGEWSIDTWDLYLQETVDRPLTEEEVLFDGYWELLDEEIETTWEFYGPLPEYVEGKIRRSIKSLEKIKRKIIRGRFWWELSNRRLAARLGISKSEVSRRRQAAIDEIGDQLKNDRATASYLIGGTDEMPYRERSRSEQIRHVYERDLNGSYLK